MTNNKNNTSFLDDFAGAGLDQITSDAVATAYLGMVQPSSAPAEAGHAVGTWRNSATDENYGTTVSAIVIGFKIVWCERDETGLTIARYEPNSIKVDIIPVAQGKKGFPKMVNPSSGNEIKELFIYAVILPEHPEAGVLLFNPSVLSMKACKSWNSMLRGQLLPNGKPAPIFAFSWNLALGLVANPKGNGKLAALVSVSKGSLVEEGLFNTTVKPQLASVGQKVLAITSDDALGIEE